MARYLFSFILVICYVNIGICQQNSLKTDLRGRDGQTTIINQTADTLKLNLTLYNYLPVGEQDKQIVILPGKSALVRFSFNYPDLIQVSPLALHIYNAPGCLVNLTVERLKPLKTYFSGDLKQENDYYNAYYNTGIDNQAYYKAGAKLSNFEEFPAVADSINALSLKFLQSYNGPLSNHFRKQEYWRLMYNNAFMKYHVPFDRSFKTGEKIDVPEKYYDFENEAPLTNPNLVLSTEYLWYAIFYLRHQAMTRKTTDAKQLSLEMLKTAERIYGENETGDVVKMRLLYDAYARSKMEYDTLISDIHFVNPANASVMDSVGGLKFTRPAVGKKAPGFKLLNMSGDTVSLRQFEGHAVIINFWAGWCAPCIKEFPFENLLYSKYKSKGLIVINICVDTPVDQWKQLSAQHHLKMVNLYSDAKQYQTFKRSYNLSALPRSVLLDKTLTVISNNFKRASEVTGAELP